MSVLKLFKLRPDKVWVWLLEASAEMLVCYHFNKICMEGVSVIESVGNRLHEEVPQKNGGPWHLFY